MDSLVKQLKFCLMIVLHETYVIIAKPFLFQIKESVHCQSTHLTTLNSLMHAPPCELNNFKFETMLPYDDFTRAHFTFHISEIVKLSSVMIPTINYFK